MTVAYTLDFEIEGTPVGQGSMKGFVKKGGARAVVVPSNQPQLKTFRSEVHEVLASIWESTGLPMKWDGPIQLDVIFHVHPPKTRKWVEAVTGTDCDKLLRALFDAIQAPGFISNDARIFKGSWERRYSDRAYTKVRLTLMDRTKYEKPRK